MKQFFLFLGLLLAVAFMSFGKAQAVSYPIKELGNCQSDTSCFAYCELPQNTAACWSYGKYVLQKNVLGETSINPEEYARQKGIIFPVTELGNCANATECMKFCQDALNKTACSQFSTRFNLNKSIPATTPIQKVSSTQFLLDAKSVLGCDGYDGCKTFCGNGENRQACSDFAKKESLTSSPTTASLTSKSTLPNFFDIIKSQLGCDSASACKAVCDDPTNYSRCAEFAKKHNFLSDSSPSPTANILYPTKTQTKGCTTDNDCYQKCLQNPTSCPGFKPTPIGTSSAIKSSIYVTPSAYPSAYISVSPTPISTTP